MYFTGVTPPDGVLPGGKTGLNRTFTGSGPSDADNGKPDLGAGSPPLHYSGSGVGKKSRDYVKLKHDVLICSEETW